MEEQEEREIPSLDIERALSDHLLETRGGWDKKGKIYASELGLALGSDNAGCQVAFWHKCRNAPTQEMDAGRLLMMQAGDLLHDWMADALKMALPVEGYRVVTVEERVFLDHDGETLGSRLDVLIEEMATGLRYVIDVKTKRGGAFSYLKEVKPADELQVQAYIKAKDAAGGWVLYVDREGQNFIRAFYVERADHRPEKAIEILKAVRDADAPPPTLPLRINVKENKGPDSVYLNAPWQMEWCDLKKCACKAALPKANPPKGIVAKLKPHKTDENDFEVVLTEEGSPWSDVILPLLVAAYPKRTFTAVHPKQEPPIDEQL